MRAGSPGSVCPWLRPVDDVRSRSAARGEETSTSTTQPVDPFAAWCADVDAAFTASTSGPVDGDRVLDLLRRQGEVDPRPETPDLIAEFEALSPEDRTAVGTAVILPPLHDACDDRGLG